VALLRYTQGIYIVDKGHTVVYLEAKDSLKPLLLQHFIILHKTRPLAGTWCKCPYLAITLHLDYCQTVAHLYCLWLRLDASTSSPFTAATAQFLSQFLWIDHFRYP